MPSVVRSASPNARSRRATSPRSASSNAAQPASTTIDTEDIVIAGHAQPVRLRVFTPHGPRVGRNLPRGDAAPASVPLAERGAEHETARHDKADTAGKADEDRSHGGPLSAMTLRLPIILFFHGGGFIRGAIDDPAATIAATTLARETPAVVVSVAYSLAPAHPFPHAVEDAWRAAEWVGEHAARIHGDPMHIGVVGHDAGGNLATVLTMIARDRGGPEIAAQVLFAPLLDPSMTRLADEDRIVAPDLDMRACAQCYRDYLPNATQRLHPYAAPLESRRLAGLPPALIASAEHDLLHIEAERYASELIAAGVPTQVTRHRSASHNALAAHPDALADAVRFFRQRLF